VSRAEFSPWHVLKFDANDTVLESRWYQDRGSPDHTRPLPAAASPNTRAAWLAAQHAGTASLTILDSLGRDVIGIAHNRVLDAAGASHDERYLTHTKLDAEGKPLWIRDARANLVMQYIAPPVTNNQPDDPTGGFAPCYDLAGNLLFQHSMDSGDRWTINDAAGNPLFTWDSRGHLNAARYDELHRPTSLALISTTHPNGIIIGLTQYATRTADDRQNNRCGRPWRTFDQSGVMTNLSFDFKGSPLRVARRLALDFDVDTDWTVVTPRSIMDEPHGLLMDETFVQLTEYDALNRMTLHYNWHRAGEPVSVYQPRYNRRGALDAEQLTVGATKTPSALAAARYGQQSLPLRMMRRGSDSEQRWETAS
jgi:hypothetical protein